MRSRKSVLVFAEAPMWPVIDGFAVRAAGLLSRLAQDWDLTVIAPRRDGVETDEPFACVERIVTANGRSGGEAVSRVLERASPDAILWWQGLDPGRLDPRWYGRTVVDEVDCRLLTAWRELRGASGLDRLRWLRHAAEMARYERWLVRSVAATTVVGDDDARVLRRIGGGDRIHVVPNGVDVPEDALPDDDREPAVVFTGVMNYPPNVDAAKFFAEKVWPLVREEHPGARFWIAGRAPSREVLALESIDGVVVKADVPDMRDVLGRASVGVAPMRQGAGIKNKVLEAWAMGLPVVLTKIATNGLELDATAAGLVADRPAEIANRVAGLLADRGRRDRLGLHARELARRAHGWEGVASKMDRLLAQVARSAG